MARKRIPPPIISDDQGAQAAMALHSGNFHEPPRNPKSEGMALVDYNEEEKAEGPPTVVTHAPTTTAMPALNAPSMENQIISVVRAENALTAEGVGGQHGITWSSTEI